MSVSTKKPEPVVEVKRFPKVVSYSVQADKNQPGTYHVLRLASRGKEITSVQVIETLEDLLDAVDCAYNIMWAIIFAREPDKHVVEGE